jgi:hypothetical protein
MAARIIYFFKMIYINYNQGKAQAPTPGVHFFFQSQIIGPPIGKSGESVGGRLGFKLPEPLALPRITDPRQLGLHSLKMGLKA